jgi:hypothetical protein
LTSPPTLVLALALELGTESDEDEDKDKDNATLLFATVAGEATPRDERLDVDDSVMAEGEDEAEMEGGGGGATTRTIRLDDSACLKPARMLRVDECEEKSGWSKHDRDTRVPTLLLLHLLLLLAGRAFGSRAGGRGRHYLHVVLAVIRNRDHIALVPRVVLVESSADTRQSTGRFRR